MEIIYLSLHCHHQNDSCIKMGSNKSHFNVSLIVRDKVTRLCPLTTTFLKRKESRSGIEPRPLCFKPAHKPFCRPPLVIRRDKSGKGAGCGLVSVPLFSVNVNPGPNEISSVSVTISDAKSVIKCGFASPDAFWR